MLNTVTRALLVEAAVEVTGASKSAATGICESMFELIGDALMQGETVKLTGFGSLQVRSRAERVGRNPRTGETHRITARHTVVFTPGARLRMALDEHFGNLPLAERRRRTTREVAAE